VAVADDVVGPAGVLQGQDLPEHGAGRRLADALQVVARPANLADLDGAARVGDFRQELLAEGAVGLVPARLAGGGGPRAVDEQERLVGGPAGLDGPALGVPAEDLADPAGRGLSLACHGCVPEVGGRTPGRGRPPPGERGRGGTSETRL